MARFKACGGAALLGWATVASLISVTLGMSSSEVKTDLLTSMDILKKYSDVLLEKQELQNQLNARVILENSQGLAALQDKLDGFKAEVTAELSEVKTESKQLITSLSSQLERKFFQKMKVFENSITRALINFRADWVDYQSRTEEILSGLRTKVETGVDFISTFKVDFSGVKAGLQDLASKLSEFKTTSATSLEKVEGKIDSRVVELQKSQTEMASSFEEANQSLERKVFLNIPRIQPKKFQMAMQRVVMQKSYRLSFVISNIQRTPTKFWQQVIRIGKDVNVVLPIHVAMYVKSDIIRIHMGWGKGWSTTPSFDIEKTFAVCHSCFHQIVITYDDQSKEAKFLMDDVLVNSAVFSASQMPSDNWPVGSLMDVIYCSGQYEDLGLTISEIDYQPLRN